MNFKNEIESLDTNRLETLPFASQPICARVVRFLHSEGNTSHAKHYYYIPLLTICQHFLPFFVTFHHFLPISCPLGGTRTRDLLLGMQSSVLLSYEGVFILYHKQKMGYLMRYAGVNDESGIIRD